MSANKNICSCACSAMRKRCTRPINDERIGIIMMPSPKVFIIGRHRGVGEKCRVG